ncbi:hypothetical protein Ahy_B05g073763 [Arachis hypogaea]|uniref:PXMP2/4 family protein n=1 Tax=Arachis hypogaea TaxID=3818 RepID=A0A444YWW4_ARAHY|nr:hypothetical protein Ahy_B05g073763 [Arachis hypogaea]
MSKRHLFLEIDFVVVVVDAVNTQHSITMMSMSRNITKRFLLNGKQTPFHAPCPPAVRPYDRIIHKASFCSSSSSAAKFGFVGWYLRKLEEHPVVTKSLTSSFIFTASDFTSQVILFTYSFYLQIYILCLLFNIIQEQMISSSSASYDFKRTFRMAVYGLLILGPSQHLWFNHLSKILPKRDVSATLKKIFMGQAVFGPVINTVFFTYNGAVQGESVPQIITRLKRDLLPTMIGGAMFWPACDFVTFKFAPVHLQPLLNSSCAYVWTIYLTYMANREK